MREYFRSLKFILLIVIAAFIGTTFLVWGKGSITGSDPTAVATVNGEEISLERYQRAYRSHMEFYRQLYQERFTPELAERLGLSQQVLQTLIQETLVIQRAKAERVAVGDAELREKIQAIRVFQEDGRFSRERYLRVLGQVRMDPAVFEEEQRREMVRKKMEATIKAGAKVSDEELRQAYVFRREKVRASWVQVEVQPLLAKVSAAPGEVEAYLKDHQAQFQRPERRRAQYVMVSPKAFVAPATDAEAETYYKEHGSEFERPQRVRAAHILARVPSTGGSEAEGKAKSRVEEAIRRVKAGEDFAAVAKAVSEDPASAPNGGDLGFVASGELVPPFEDALFALKKGEVTREPVRTPFGYHAIKAGEIQPGGKRPFKEAAASIKEKLQNEGSERKARDKTEEVRNALQSAKDFQAEAKRLGLEPKEILMARGMPLPQVGRAPEVEEAAFALAVGGLSSPLKTPAGYLLLKVTERLPSAVPPLAEIEGEVAGAVRRQKAEALALEKANGLIQTAQKEEDLLALAKKEGLPFGETGLFSRSEQAADKRLPAEATRAALELGAGKVSQPVKTPQGVFVVKTLERKPPDPVGFDKEREELGRQLLEQKKNHLWESWLASLRASAKIEASKQFPALTLR
jgi:peptidyl-prolyl cis-trans isomerase D